MSWQDILNNFHLFLSGLWVTIHLISLSLFIGFLLSIPLALIRHFKVPILNRTVWCYTYFFRATPLLLQIFLIYYGSGQFQWLRESWMWFLLEKAYFCALLAFTLNTTAYTTEIIRGALDTMNPREIEAGFTFGMTKAQVYRRIVLPNALRRCIPAYSNEVIFLFHSSAVASVITVNELTGVASYLYAKYYDPFTPFLTVAGFYMVLIFSIIFFFRQLEKKFLKYLSAAAIDQKKFFFGNPPVQT